MGKIQAKSIFRLVPLIGDLGRFLWAFTLKTCINKFYGCIDLRVIFQSAHRIKSFFPYKDRFNRSQMSKVVYKASCWDCQDSYIGKTKRRLHDRKTEHFKGITSTCHASATRDLKIGRRDELGRLPEVNLHNRACAREFLPRVFAVVVSSRTPFREFCRRVENVSISIFF